jgi:hypothetical protein
LKKCCKSKQHKKEARMKTLMLCKIIVVAFMFFVSGCNTVSEKQEAGDLKLLSKDEPVKWVSVGTLISVGPDMELTRRPSRLGSVVLGETKLSRTRVETSEGVYIISGKIGVVEIGVPVSIGYKLSDEYPDTPSYLAFGGEQYQIVH